MAGRSGNPELTHRLLSGGVGQKQGEDYVIDAFKENDANMAATAEYLDVGLSTLKRWVKRYPRLTTAFHRLREIHEQQPKSSGS